MLWTVNFHMMYQINLSITCWYLTSWRESGLHFYLKIRRNQQASTIDVEASVRINKTRGRKLENTKIVVNILFKFTQRLITILFKFTQRLITTAKITVFENSVQVHVAPDELCEYMFINGIPQVCRTLVKSA